METTGPPVIYIDGQGEIIHLSAAAGRFLTFATGKITGNLLQAIHPDLRGAYQAASERSSVSQQPQTSAAPRVCLGGKFHCAWVRVSPIDEILPSHRLVAIEAHPLELPMLRDRTDATEAEQLRRQLDDLSAQHAEVLEKYHADTEELRTALEELETGREEYATLNEELTATNATLQEKLTELSRANSDLQNLVAATNIATVFLDRKGRITRYTPAATALFHLTAGDAGRLLADLRHDLDYPELETDAARVLADLQPVEREVGGNEGEHFLVRLQPYRTTDDRIVGVVLTCLSITERRQAEAHRQAKEAAERIHSARSEFLSRMSHELRTPLNAILGFGQLLELGSRDEQDRHALGLILKAGRHLLSLVDEVLDLTCAESGQMRLALGAVDLKRLALECVQMTSRLAEARQVTCEIERIRPPLPPLWTDEHRLRQMLLNLLTNAIKYNRPGGRVTLGCRRTADGRCVLSVCDTGPGIAAEDLPRLFAPFERLHHAHGEVEGTGLGLAITRRLAAALDGSVGAESKLGQGSRFWIELPLGCAPATPSEAAGSAKASTLGSAATHELTLLCVEDNASNSQLLEMIAARQWPDWRFLSAQDGSTGLKLARRHAPNLILLDLQLPDRPGDQVLAELRRDPRTCRLPVVVLSADATAHSREKLLAGGAAGFLTKPFHVDDLVRMVNEVMRPPATSG